jgi:hypothetical protein
VNHRIEATELIDDLRNALLDGFLRADVPLSYHALDSLTFKMLEGFHGTFARGVGVQCNSISLAGKVFGDRSANSLCSTSCDPNGWVGVQIGSVVVA